MQRYCFTLRSITAAMQAQSKLKQAGIRADVMRTPSNLRTNGCGYCLRVGDESFPAAQSILSGTYQRIFKRDDRGSWQEAAL